MNSRPQYCLAFPFYQQISTGVSGDAQTKMPPANSGPGLALHTSNPSVLTVFFTANVPTNRWGPIAGKH